MFRVNCMEMCEQFILNGAEKLWGCKTVCIRTLNPIYVNGSGCCNINISCSYIFLRFSKRYWCFWKRRIVSDVKNDDISVVSWPLQYLYRVFASLHFYLRSMSSFLCTRSKSVILTLLEKFRWKAIYINLLVIIKVYTKRVSCRCKGLELVIKHTTRQYLLN